MTESSMTQYDLHVEDCLLVLASMPDASVDSIVTDPPYLIDFMGKGWDAADGIAGKPDVWAECLRVLKPGGHLLAFGATRTYHRMTVAIEDAGFEIRDSIHWAYGSGFPKSLDVSKAIDKAAGAERKVVGTNPNVVRTSKTEGGSDYGGFTQANPDVTAPATTEAQQWQGWGTALKPSHEPIVVARKPLAGTVAQNVLAYGTGGLNIDGTRVGTEERFNPACRVEGGTPSIGGGWTATEGRPAKGRWPANTVLTHAADCQATGETVTDDIALNGEGNDNHFHGNFNGGHDKSPKTETITAYDCVPGCPVALLDQQSDKGGASRFFTTTEWTELDDIAPFLYVAKPSKKERNAGVDGANQHPTVKPVALMRHLVRLVTPPGGVVLDPFTGSGTTGVAAILEGARFIGIEMTEEYVPIIEARLTHATQQTTEGK